MRNFFGAYMAFIFSYNALSVMVTNELDSVWHSILDLYRPITVWGLDLFIFYYFRNPAMGEAWLVPSSLIQLTAMAVLLYGTAIYNGSAPVLFGVCGSARPGGSRGLTPKRLASPMLTRSPLLVRVAEAEAVRKSPRFPSGGGPGGRPGASIELPPYQGVSNIGARRNSDV